MCLDIKDTTEAPERKIATEDLYCFKVLSVHNEGTPDVFISSPYRHYEYKLGATVHSGLVLSLGQYYYVDRGLHSFADFEGAEYEMNDWMDDEMYVFVAVIPKGSHYFEGTFGYADHKSYASTRLKVLHRDDPESLKRLANLPSRKAK